MTTTAPPAALALVARWPDLLLQESVGGDLLDPVFMGAVLSPGDEAYRYMLWRIFDPALPTLVVVMLNPSTADHREDDATIRGLVSRARKLGYGGILVVNCFGLRAREPEDMMAHADPVGPCNDDAVRLALPGGEQMVLCAWGAHGLYLNRQDEIACAIKESGSRPHALKVCANGAPGHPLYIAHTARPFAWPVICPNS